MYPGVMSGGEAISITKDEEPVRTLPLHSSVVETTLQAEPWQMVHLQFDYNSICRMPENKRTGPAGSHRSHYNTVKNVTIHRRRSHETSRKQG